MQSRSLLGAAVLGVAMLGTGAAQAISAVVSVTPPAPRVEVVPAARAGLVWAPGHWEWTGSHFVWEEGHWLRARAGYEYREPRWVQRADGTWFMVGNTWERRGPYGDRDGDGIANRYDRDRDGDGIRNRRDARPNVAANRYGPNGDLDGDGVLNRNDRDRDGDGIRNARDGHPDNDRRG